MPHITTHVNFATPIREHSKVKVGHCAALIFLIGVAVGFLL